MLLGGLKMSLKPMIDNTIIHLSTLKMKLVVAWPAFVNGMGGALLILCLYHICIPYQKIGTVNVTGILDQFIKENATKTISPNQLKMKVHLFGQTLEKTLQVLSKEEHVLFLPREAVIAGSMDYTSIVTRQLKKSLLLGIKK
jgi:hypothetical protein